MTAVLERAQAAGTRYETEHRILRPDGSVRWTHGWAKARLDDAGAVVGYIGVVADVTERHLADEERMQLLAEQTAARADAEAARQRAEQSAREFAAVADTLQRSRLPPLAPEIPGAEVAACYHPALDGLAVGGDFYDVPMLGRRTWGLVLGDVCGKGAAAAAVTGLVRYALRTAATQTSWPAAVLRQVSAVLRRDQEGLDDAGFATAVFGRVRPRPGALDISFALGGHPPPYVLRHHGHVEVAGRPGTLLGVLDDPTFFTTKITLGPGDALIALTDGVLEARNAAGVELEEHLIALLSEHAGESAAQLVAAIQAAAVDWQDGPPRDDIAVVVVRMPDAAAT